MSEQQGSVRESVSGEEHCPQLAHSQRYSSGLSPVSPKGHTRGSSSALTDFAAGTGALRAWQDSQQRYPVPPSLTAPHRVLSARPLLPCPVPSMRDEHAAGLGRASWGTDLQTPWLRCPAQRCLWRGSRRAEPRAPRGWRAGGLRPWSVRGVVGRWEWVQGRAAGMRHTGTLFGQGGRKSGR